MFTSVDSIKKKGIKHLPKLDASESSLIEYSDQSVKKFKFVQQLKNLFSERNDYVKMQFVIFTLTFVFALLFSCITSFFIGFSFGLSLLFGSIFGIFYLRLLAKSIGNLGKFSSGVSKTQLLVPIFLFIFASKMEFIDILPAIIGFFIYKPAIIFYFSRP